jgi:hypothetical protein
MLLVTWGKRVNESIQEAEPREVASPTQISCSHKTGRAAFGDDFLIATPETSLCRLLHLTHHGDLLLPSFRIREQQSSFVLASWTAAREA